jgi:hypothetical protein
VSERLLAHIARASHRSESTLLKRFPTAAKALAVLKRDGFVDYHDDACTAVHISAAGRAELARLRARAERRAA